MPAIGVRRAKASIFAGCLAGLNREPLSRIGHLRIGYGIDPDKIISPGSITWIKPLFFIGGKYYRNTPGSPGKPSEACQIPANPNQGVLRLVRRFVRSREACRNRQA